MNTLYLLGGNGSCKAWWENVLPLFQHYQAASLELPGFGSNTQAPCHDLTELAAAVLAQTRVGSSIVAVGINALPVLHAVARSPKHFKRVILLAPVGAFLWQRHLPRLMQVRFLRKIIHTLLAHWPALFKRKFSNQRWTPEQYARMGQGYLQCRAFESYWDIMRPDSALSLLDWITTPIEIVWGGQDRVVSWQQSAAWSAILARADLSVTLQKKWGHYPWIDDPADFVNWLEGEPNSFPAHTKAGRLILAELAGLPVPAQIRVTQAYSPALTDLLKLHPKANWAVRASGAQEDGADQSHAGQSRSFLRIHAASVSDNIQELLIETEAVVVQRFIEPLCSGVAFARHLSVEIEWVDGHLSALTDGRLTPQRVVLSRMPQAWHEGDFQSSHGLTRKLLWDFLQSVVRIFHYSHCDIEWAWDGTKLHLLQVRPVTTCAWRRHLTAANIGEILPQRPSRLMEYAQRRAAASIPAIWSRWDSQVLRDSEPFTALHAGASYINQDLFLARLNDWGMSGTRYAQEIGAVVPHIPQRPWRWLWKFPIFIRMLYASRKSVHTLNRDLNRFEAELKILIANKVDAQELADWFARFYVAIVQANLCIGATIATSGGTMFGHPPTLYRNLATETAPHRVPFETDPTSPRPTGQLLALQDFPKWPQIIHAIARLGLPGLRGYYLQVREWYRDNLMRIFYRLYHTFPKSMRHDWFIPHDFPRAQSGSFWQDGSASEPQNYAFMIYPGQVIGQLGHDILLVDNLDPGRYASYRTARAVIARSGGRLSHGATLLRELGKPSAVMPNVSESWRGQWVYYHNGHLQRVNGQDHEHT